MPFFKLMLRFIPNLEITKKLNNLAKFLPLREMRSYMIVRTCLLRTTRSTCLLSSFTINKQKMRLS